jgi:BNR repeat-like domain
VRVREHRAVFSDRRLYCAHPHGVRLVSGEIIVVFNRAPRRDFILHPPQDPTYENVLIRSADGRTWSAPSVVPDYGWSGVECAGLTALKSGRVLLNQWRFRWYPLPLARKLAASEPIAFPAKWVGALAASLELDAGAALQRDPERLVPWARGLGGTFVHISDDGGATFERSVKIDTAPFSGGYGMRGAVECPDGTVVLPLCDVPAYERVFVVRSRDGAASWEAPILAVAEPGREFEEPAPLLLPSGRILLALRENVARTIFTTCSDDGGSTWTKPAATGIDGYPAHLLALDDGAILCTYGDRKPPFAIRAVISEDGGATWPAKTAIAIREGLPNKDLGYPFTVALPDGSLMTIYYAQDSSGTTGIHATEWELQPQKVRARWVPARASRTKPHAPPAERSSTTIAAVHVKCRPPSAPPSFGS